MVVCQSCVFSESLIVSGTRTVSIDTWEMNERISDGSTIGNFCFIPHLLSFLQRKYDSEREFLPRDLFSSSFFSLSLSLPSSYCSAR
jgi:hypothetical protein